ncbi:hypothetical protein FACS1894190_09670 [Spirochaetia bacterium]|nr:hypothetical protein FACS1894190_09670 [Spirochaetia bacterium]
MYRTDENDTGGYYFSPFDLQLLSKAPLLAAAGINALKIEGRMKSAEYVGTVVRAYRKVIDSIKDNSGIEKATAEANTILQGDFARKKTTYYFDDTHNASSVDRAAEEAIFDPASDGGTGIRLGVIKKVRGAPGGKEGLVDCTAYTPQAADSIRLHKADDSLRVSFKLTSVEKAGAANSCWLSIPDGFDLTDCVYIIQIKNNSRHYAQFIKSGSGYSKRQPGHERAPFVQYQFKKSSPVKQGAPRKKFLEPFKEGIYTAVSRIEDMYTAQSIRTQGLILSLNNKIIKQLTGERKPLPFKPQETILSLDPYCTQNDEDLLCTLLHKFIENGYNRFIVNNLSHLPLLKNTETHLIAGPYLYTFNRFSAAFLQDANLSYFVSPFENNRQNLERTWETGERNNIFVPVFAYPPLFKISGELNYGAKKFYDKNDEQFRLINESGRAAVFAEIAFSIVDKIPFLKQAGFKHFIIDFSGPPLNKQDYKAVISGAENAQPLAGTSRFNWKNGFFEPEEKK